MSALICIATNEAAYIFSDGSAYVVGSFTNHGRVAKLLCLPHLDCVVGVVGRFAAATLAASVIADAGIRDFDDLMERGAAVLRRAWNETPEKVGLPQTVLWGDYILGVAGWSRKNDRAQFFSVSNFARDGFESFEPIVASEFRYPEVSFPRLDRERPVESGLAVMRQQRDEIVSPVVDGQIDRTIQLRGADGHCQLAVVSRNSISTRILETWVDR